MRKYLITVCTIPSSQDWPPAAPQLMEWWKQHTTATESHSRPPLQPNVSGLKVTQPPHPQPLLALSPNRAAATLLALRTCSSFCLACCSSSCSRPLKKPSPTGTRRFRQATFRLLCASRRHFLSLRRPPGRLPASFSCESDSTLAMERRVAWLGMMRAMLSISLWATKFCSSRLKNWKRGKHHLKRHIPPFFFFFFFLSFTVQFSHSPLIIFFWLCWRFSRNLLQFLPCATQTHTKMGQSQHVWSQKVEQFRRCFWTEPEHTDRLTDKLRTDGQMDMVIPVSPPLSPNTLLDKAYTDKRTDGQMDMVIPVSPLPPPNFIGGLGGGGIRINKILDNKQKTHTQKTMTLSVNTVLSPNPPKTWSTWWRSPPHRRRVPLPPLLGSSANGSGADQRTWWAVGSTHRCRAPGW